MEEGDLGVILVGSDPIADIYSAEWEEMTRSRDTTVAGGGGAAHRGTIKETTGTIDAFVNRSDAGQTALKPGALVTIQIRPEGTGSGLAQLEIVNALVQRVRQRLLVPDDFNRVTFSFIGPPIDDTPQA